MELSIIDYYEIDILHCKSDHMWRVSLLYVLEFVWSSKVWVKLYLYIYFFYQHIRMISEGSCDTKDWNNDAENSALHQGINYNLKHNHNSIM